MVENRKGTLVISLDFELMWGMIDISTPQEYGITNVANVGGVIDEMLSLFKKYDIHATFATVGFISYSNKHELLADIPTVKPSYANTIVSPYENNYIADIGDEYSSLYFAPDLIKKIKETNGMEIGTHTYCHYYCTELGQTPEEFRADLLKAIATGKNNGIDIRSIVFPRNQVTLEYLKICAQEGVSVYRGNATKFYDLDKSGFALLWQRICRLADNYINLSGKNSYSVDELSSCFNMKDVRASRMLRPHSKMLAFMEPFRLRRIKGEISYAAKHGEMYHLWWHPHNFGAETSRNMLFLEQILQHFDKCRKEFGMETMNMIEYSTKIN